LNFKKYSCRGVIRLAVRRFDRLGVGADGKLTHSAD
jgi:hypothetical protein